VVVLFASADLSSYMSTHNMRAFLISLPAAECGQCLSCMVFPLLCLKYDDVFICMMCVYTANLLHCSEYTVLSSVLYSCIHKLLYCYTIVRGVFRLWCGFMTLCSSRVLLAFQRILLPSV
jgi:hypothetical protein